MLALNINPNTNPDPNTNPNLNPIPNRYEKEDDIQKNRTKNQNVLPNRQISPRNPRISAEANAINGGNEEKVRRDLESLKQRDEAQANRSVRSKQLPDYLTEYIVKLEEALRTEGLKSFVKTLKSLAMLTNNNNDCIPPLLPLLMKIEVKELDSSMTADLIWSLGKLNLIVQNYDHKAILTSLMNRFGEHESLTPREVTTSLVSFI
jgi:hypothetical protein